MEKITYYKFLISGIFHGIVDALNYKPRIFDDYGEITIYGIETSKNIKCKQCGRTIAIYWNSGDVKFMSSFLDTFKEDMSCASCGYRTRKDDVLNSVRDVLDTG